jgi:membrane protein
MKFLGKIKKNVSSSRPATYMVQRSKRTHLPGFGGVPLFDVIKFFFQQVKTVGMTERASSIAFNFVMAIPPMIIFFFTLIPLMPISNQFEQELYNLIRSVVPGEKDHAELIHFLEDFINNPRNDLLSLGFILSIFFSSNAVMGVMRSFDKNYIGFKKRTDLQKRVAAIKITFVLIFFVIVAVLLLVAQGRILTWLGIENPFVRGGIENLRWVFIVLMLFACISYIYRHAPAVHKKWRMMSPGSVLATVMMLLFSIGFSWWVSRFGNFNELYGSIGTVMIIMALIFINSLVLLIGFELNVSINSLRKIADERKEKQMEGGATTV